MKQTSPLVGACILNSVEFGVYNECKEWFSKRHVKEGPLSLYKIAIAGALSGVVGSLVTTPTEYLKCNLQVESNMNHKFNGPFDLMRHLYKQQLQSLNSSSLNSSHFVVKYMHRMRSYLRFYKSINRGFAITTLRESGLALYFGSYEATMRFLQFMTIRNNTSPQKPPTWHSLIGGGIGGLVFWTVMFPVDMIKTRIQIDSIQNNLTLTTPTSGHHQHHHGSQHFVSTWEMMKRIYSEQGTSGFYSGYKSAILRAIIVNAAVFATYEQVKHFMREK